MNSKRKLKYLTVLCAFLVMVLLPVKVYAACRNVSCGCRGNGIMSCAGQPAGIRIPMDAPVIAGICMMNMGQPAHREDLWNTIARSAREDESHPPLRWGMTGDRGIA